MAWAVQAALLPECFAGVAWCCGSKGRSVLPLMSPCADAGWWLGAVEQTHVGDLGVTGVAGWVLVVVVGWAVDTDVR